MLSMLFNRALSNQITLANQKRHRPKIDPVTKPSTQMQPVLSAGKPRKEATSGFTFASDWWRMWRDFLANQKPHKSQTEAVESFLWTFQGTAFEGFNLSLLLFFFHLPATLMRRRTVLK